MASSKSILEQISSLKKKVRMAILLPTLIITSTVLVALSYHFVESTSSMIITNHRESFVYWLRVGDRFQIERAIQSFNEQYADWFIQVKYGDLTLPQGSSDKSHHSLKFTAPLLIVNQSKGEIVLSAKFPVLLLISFALPLILSLGLLAIPFRRQVGLMIEELREPLENYIRSMKGFNSYRLADHKYNFKFVELNEISQATQSMVKRLRLQDQNLAEIESQSHMQSIVKEIAHDLQSPLAYQKAIRDSLEDSMSPALYKGLGESINRIDQIIQRTLRSKRLACEYFEIREVLVSVVNLKKEEFSSRSTLQILLRAFPDHVIRANKDRVSSIVSNLINNAIESTEDTLIVEIEAGILNENFVLTVKDTGPGIPDAVLKKLGTKGFSYLKPRGNGLGLYSAAHSMNLYGGSLEVKSSLGSGTSVFLRFPVCN